MPICQSFHFGISRHARTDRLPGCWLIICIALIAWSPAEGWSQDHEETWDVLELITESPRQPPTERPPHRTPAAAVSRLELPFEPSELPGIYQLVFSPDGATVAARDREQRIHLCDAESGKRLTVLSGHTSQITAMQFSADGRFLVSAADGLGEVVRIWNVAQGRQTQTIRQPATHLRFLADGSLLIVTNVDVRRYDVVTGAELHQRTSGIPDHTMSLAISHQGGHLVLFRPNRARTKRYPLVNYDLVSAQSSEVAFLPHSPRSVHFSPDDRLIAVCGQRSENIFICELAHPDTFHILQGHSGIVQNVAFSSDGRFLVSAGFDGTVRIWELLSFQSIVALDAHTDHINAVAVSPDGRRFATGAAGLKDNAAYVWSLTDLLLQTSSHRRATRYEKLWQQLGHSDPRLAYRAIGQFIVAGIEAHSFLEASLVPFAEPINAAGVAQLIAQLDDDRFQIREAAFQQLIPLRSAFEPELRSALRSSTASLETRSRIRRLLATTLPAHLMSDVEFRRLSRIVYLLEIKQDDFAKRQLESLAIGHPDGRIMKLAGAARRRMKKRENAASPDEPQVD